MSRSRRPIQEPLLLECLVRKSWGAGQGWGDVPGSPPHHHTGSQGGDLCPPRRAQAHLLLLAADADQPPVQFAAGVPGLDPFFGALTEVVALLLEIDPLLGADVAHRACGGEAEGAAVGGTTAGAVAGAVGTMGRAGGSVSPGVWAESRSTPGPNRGSPRLPSSLEV